MTWNPVVPSVEDLAALDPYLEFAKETGFAYFYAGATEFESTIPVVIELRNGRTAKQFAHDWNNKPWLRIPTTYRNPPAGLQSMRHLTAEVTADFFVEMANAPGLDRWVKRIALGVPIQAQTADILKPLSALGFKAPRKVVTGIIDDGLAFANACFRNGTQSRIEYLWCQDGTPPGPVPGFGYGREYLRSEIETEIANATHAPFVDEDQVYRATHHVDFTLPRHKSAAQRAAHGTHVMHLATQMSSGVLPADRPIIGVQLPTATTADTSGGSLAKPVYDGVNYIIDRADAIAAEEKSRALPIVINLSYGSIAGPHDGTSVLEAALDELIRKRRKVAPFAIVLPAGNSHLARCHAQFPLSARTRQKLLHWRVQPDDATPSFMEIWLPKRKVGRARVEIKVTPPSGPASPWIQQGELYAWQPHSDVLCKVIYYDSMAAGRERNMIFIALAPTATLHSTREIAPSGVWSVLVRNVGPAATIDAWIQRDDTPYGFPRRGRQSYFDDPAYELYDDGGRPIEVDNVSYTKRKGTINAIATGRKPIVIGGHRRSDLMAARYSASGPVVHPPGRGLPCDDGPDAMAPSVDSVACHGVLAAGTRSGSVVAMHGTSVAAPGIANWVAGRMAASLPYGRGAVAQRASMPPLGTPNTAPPALPEHRAGKGRMKLPALVDRRREN